MSQLPEYTGCTGTVPEALEIMEKANLAGALAVNTIPIAFMRQAAREQLPAHLSAAEREQAEQEIEATLRERLRRRNDRSCQTAQEHPRLWATITIDPAMGAEGMATEIRERASKHAVRAIKLHPPIGRFYPNDRVFWPAYQAAAEVGLPIVFHVGPQAHPDHPDQPAEYSKPEHYEDILSTFPNLKVVLAHMGVGPADRWPYLFRPYYQAALNLARRHPGFHFDLSATLGAGWQPQDLLQMIRQVGPERVLFGSDFPWWDPRDVLRSVEQLGLGAEEKRLILGENAVRLFGLEVATIVR